MDGLVFLAYAHHSLFDDRSPSLGRGLMWAFSFKLMRAVSLPVAAGLVAMVPLGAWVVSRRR
jgi:hypothetical protein